MLNLAARITVSGSRIATATHIRRLSYASLRMASSIGDVVKHDHREIESYYDQIVKSSDEVKQTEFQNQFTWELARHSIAEELVLYPAMEKHLADGTSLAQKDREEHQKVKEKLKAFQNMRASDPQFLSTIDELMRDLSQHIKEEESQDLPQLEQAVSIEESESLSKAFERTKKFVPTRSHPSAPDKPPYETAIGLMTAPIDKLADIFRKWPAE